MNDPALHLVRQDRNDLHSAPRRLSRPGANPAAHGFLKSREAQSAAPPGRILVVDDDPSAREALARALTRLGHEVVEARGAEDALRRLPDGPDLVLLDVHMPGMDGFTLLEMIRKDPNLWQTPVIMVTGLDGASDRLRAVYAGANDFISKPFEVVELKVRTEAQLRLKAATDAIKRHGEELERRVKERTRELALALEREASARARVQEAHLDTIQRLVLAAEFKDRETAAHIERIGRFSELLGRELGLGEEDLAILRPAASMHDIGKLGVPDAILGKPGPLDGEETRIMQGHTAAGARILHGSPSPILAMGAAIALTHHERWDGKGYPRGLAEEEIPLEGRICAVADVFDALTTDRPYRKALPNEVVLTWMEAERGRHFDPEVLDALLRRRREVEEIQAEHGNPGLEGGSLEGVAERDGR